MNHADALTSFLEEQFQLAKQAGWALAYHFPGDMAIEIHATHGDHAEQQFSTKNVGPVSSPADLAAWAQRCANVLHVLTPSPVTWSGEMKPDGTAPLGGEMW